MEWSEFGAKSTRFICRPIAEDARINILHGSVRSAKTVTMIPKWLNYVRSGPAGLLLMTGKSRATLKTNVLNDIFDTIGTRNYSYNKQSGDLSLFGRHIKCIGIKDEGSEEYIRGMTLAGAYIDEATTAPESCFKQILNRLSVENAKLYGTTNPDSPYHYLYADYITDADKIASRMVDSIHFELDDNPNLSTEYLDFIKAAYSGLWYRRMILGQWVQAEGAIFDMYDDARHVITAEQEPATYNRMLVGVDYGAGNPTVFVLIGVTYERGDRRKPTFYVLDEYYHDPRKSGSKTAAQYKQDFIDFIGDNPINAIYPDPSALDFINELKSPSCGRRFTNVGRSNNEVLPGINTVSTAMTAGRWYIVGERCPNGMKEVVSYIWDEKAQKRGEDKPVKENDHFCDAMRYPIHTEYPATKRGRVYVSAA